jgi:hypothetical protein
MRRSTNATLVMQRVVGIALGYEDLNDHDQLRCDPMLAVLAGKVEASRQNCAPFGQVSNDAAAIETLFVDLFLDAHTKAPKQIILDLDATDDPLHGQQEGRFFHGYYDCYCVRPDGAYRQRREDPSRQMSVWSGS